MIMKAFFWIYVVAMSIVIVVKVGSIMFYAYPRTVTIDRGEVIADLIIYITALWGMCLVWNSV